MQRVVRIGTRESQLALWQANAVKKLIEQQGYQAELVLIKSEGDIDLVTPLYAIGVQGVFTKTLDAALLNDRIDIAVHSMKDVPTQLAKGIAQAAVLPRASYRDLLVLRGADSIDEQLLAGQKMVVATSSIRRKAQWLHRYPNHEIDNLRGNVNTRLRKLGESSWLGAIFAAAGLERINLRPENAMELDWMLPAPAQGAIMVVCREDDSFTMDVCNSFNDEKTALCVKIERDFLRTLMGGCSTPISALAELIDDHVVFKGNVLTPDGLKKASVEEHVPVTKAKDLGIQSANKILQGDGRQIMEEIRNAK
jgi:hydroxymethylbilane synthase